MGECLLQLGECLLHLGTYSSSVGAPDGRISLQYSIIMQCDCDVSISTVSTRRSAAVHASMVEVS